MSGIPEQKRCWKHLSIVLRGQTDGDMYTTAGCLFCELDGIPKREPDAFAFYMDRQKEERIRRVIITCDTKAFFTDGWNFDWLDMPANLPCPSSCADMFTVARAPPLGVSSSSWVVFLSESLKQDEERLKRSSLAYIFLMAR